MLRGGYRKSEQVSAALFEVITVHCCWCKHAVRDQDPMAAHDAMEAHYAANHRALIDYWTGASK